jgi:CubicO group peptidase (beta-lactamase class C family)
MFRTSFRLLAVFGAMAWLLCTANWTRATEVAIKNGRWHINGAVTNPGSAAEGLLMNVRMVNATFEDRNPETSKPGFDADANNAEFIAQIPDYARHGVNAFTLCLQGGMPGYEGALNSAYTADGSLRPEYMQRIRRVLDACDRQGVAVILGCYYQRQSKLLTDDDALRAGVVNTVKWIQATGLKNIVLEIANEYPHRGFAHALLRDPQGQASLIKLAKATAPGLLVTASGLGDGVIHAPVAEACDFLTPHWNGTKAENIPERLAKLKQYGKPIVVNEDDKTAERAVAALRESVAGGAAYGLMLKDHNQTYPFQFHGAADDPVFYAALKQITSAIADRSPPKPASSVSAYFPPPDSQGGWRTPASAEEARRMAGIDVAKLDEALAVAKASTKNGGILVVKNGWLVYEKYFGLAHRDATPNLASCGKSFTSIAVGILMSERPELFPDGLDQKVFLPAYMPPEAFPLSDPAKAEIKLGQLLAFTAGIRGNNPSRVLGKDVTIDPPGPDGAGALIEAVAHGRRGVASKGVPTSAATLWCKPGEGYSYATSSAHLASMIVRHVAGMELEAYIRQRLATPLGWGPFTYGYKNSRELTHTPGGGGIAVRATDMARFGYLLLREGRWAGKEVVPAEYVHHCGRASPYNPHSPYSLQFDVNTDGHMAGYPRDAFWKSGSGAHMIYVVPSLDLVVWKLAGRDAQYDEANTGVKPDPAAVKRAEDRRDWRPTLGEREGQQEVLRKVIAAIVEPKLP